MHGRKSQSPNLEPVNLKLEKTLYTLRHLASKVKTKDKTEMDLQQQAQSQQEIPFKNYFSQLAKLSTSYLEYPNVVARSFELT